MADLTLATHRREAIPDLPPAVRANRAMLALDLGTATGWALHGIDGLITSGTVSFRPGRFDGGGMRYLRFTNWLTEIDRLSGPVAAIWFEEVRRHAATDAAHVYGGLMTELGTWDEALLSSELNELLAEDFDLSLVGFSDGELDKLLAYVAEDDGEEGGAGGSVPPVTIPEPPRNPASRTGDLWILGDNRLLCGDSTSAADVRRLMNGERAILFATDPPYLVDYDGSNHPTRNKDWSVSYGTTWDDSSQGAELYDGFIAAAVAEAIAEDAAWYCWHASRRQAMLEACWEKAGAFVHQQIIWVKDRGVLTRSHYLWKHEPCFMGWRRPNRPPKVAEETLPSTWALPCAAGSTAARFPRPRSPMFTKNSERKRVACLGARP